jgi:hypothetical protein
MQASQARPPGRACTFSTTDQSQGVCIVVLSRIVFACSAVLLAATGCDDGKPAVRDAPGTAAADAPAGTIDSILPIEEHLRRFRKGLPQVDTLTGGYPSRDSLVAAMLAATSARDTTALVRMRLTAAEYAWLYYPAHIYTAPPYELDPGTFWMMIEANNSKGLGRLLHHRGGNRIVLRSYECQASEAVRAPVREWNRCTLQLTVNRVESNEQLFGSIVEIGGRYKFVSYANQF